MTEPGTVTIQRLSDGTRVVTQASTVIRVSTDLLRADDLDVDAVEPDGTLRLDTEGLYRYRFVRNDGEDWRIYERITEVPT
ncbi:hypothetical protein [Lentzea cavernae]|uniref:hypothetical protein n=1 Tax=Lentzea cavernae TaxID=2020703 RepID=UPI00174DEEC3|nr:hypothetical protein [Lentzea cavernae]